MKRFLLAVLLALTGAAARAMPPEEIAAFHDLIPTASAEEVSAALAARPALAAAPDKYGFQAIHLLDYIDFETKLALLIAHGASINAANDEGITLLHILIDPEFLPVVLQHGGDLEARDRNGRTVLAVHLSEPDNADMIAALLASGADPTAVDNAGRSVLDIAEAGGDREILHMLRAAGAR